MITLGNPATLFIILLIQDLYNICFLQNGESAKVRMLPANCDLLASSSYCDLTLQVFPVSVYSKRWGGGVGVPFAHIENMGLAWWPLSLFEDQSLNPDLGNLLSVIMLCYMALLLQVLTFSIYKAGLRWGELTAVVNGLYQNWKLMFTQCLYMG